MIGFATIISSPCATVVGATVQSPGTAGVYATLAVTVPALKFPLASLATTVLTVFADVASEAMVIDPAPFVTT